MTGGFATVRLQELHDSGKPHHDKKVLKFLLQERDKSYREAADALQDVFNYSVHHTTVKKAADKRGVNLSTFSAVTDLLNGENTEPAQPPSYLLGRSDDTPVHPVDTDCFETTNEVWGEIDPDQVLNADNNTPNSLSNHRSSTAASDSRVFDSTCSTGVYKGLSETPNQFRVSKLNRESSLVAPPYATSQLPAKFHVCGCGDCKKRHYLDGDSGGAIDCDTPLPCTVGGARRIFQVTEGTSIATDKQGNAEDRAKHQYKQISYTDSACLRSELTDCNGTEGDIRFVDPRDNRENITTVLVSLRQSPTDNQDRIVTPFRLVQDCKSAFYEAHPLFPRDCEEHGHIASYWLLAGTDNWASPHIHYYSWFFDPENQIDQKDFTDGVAEYVKRATFAGDCHLDDGQLVDGTVRVENETLPVDPDVLTTREVPSGTFESVERDTDNTGPERLVKGIDLQTQGAIYLATQSPKFALVGAENDADTEIAAILKASDDGRHNAHGLGRFYDLSERLEDELKAKT